MTREEIISSILSEREKHKTLHGSEWDANNSPNDWISLICHYASVEIKRKGVKPEKDFFIDSLIKCSAVIIAALENIQKMQDSKHFN